jgi:hypothetical protein
MDLVQESGRTQSTASFLGESTASRQAAGSVFAASTAKQNGRDLLFFFS